MKIEYRKENGVEIAVISSDTPVVASARDALELAMNVQHEKGVNRLAIEKSAVAEEFFVLSTGLAGEILQKFINYHVKAAFWGDYSRYTSKPLQDFIYESNQGNHFFFVSAKEEALKRLAEAR